MDKWGIILISYGSSTGNWRLNTANTKKLGTILRQDYPPHIIMTGTSINIILKSVCLKQFLI